MVLISLTIITSLPLVLLPYDTWFSGSILLLISSILLKITHMTVAERVKLRVKSGKMGSGKVGSGKMGGNQFQQQLTNNYRLISKNRCWNKLTYEYKHLTLNHSFVYPILSDTSRTVCFDRSKLPNVLKIDASFGGVETSKRVFACQR